MPSPKSRRRGDQEKKWRLSEKASSFHGRGTGPVAEMLPRPRTLPNLLSERRSGAYVTEEPAARRTLPKLLLHVTVLRSPGALHVLMPPEATVEDLIMAAMREYAKEARRPVLTWADASGFNLHYSQFSLQSLDRADKLTELGSRNFFLCPRNAAATTESGGAVSNCGEGGGAAATTTKSNCSKEVDKKGLIWLKFMDMLLC